MIAFKNEYFKTYNVKHLYRKKYIVEHIIEHVHDKRTFQIKRNISTNAKVNNHL